MLHFTSEVVNRENAYQSNEIEARRLEQLQTQLESFNLQATLIVGFALATINSDNLVNLADETSRFCVYKRPVLAHIYVLLSSFSIATCMSCVGLSFFVIFRSQKAANEVSVHHTVALVRRVKTSIMGTYFIGMAAFFASFILCAFMYFAYPNWTEISAPPRSEGARQVCQASSSGGVGNAAAGSGLPAGVSVGAPSPPGSGCDTYVTASFDVPVIKADNGKWYAACLDPYSSAHLELQRNIGLSLAITCMASFLMTFLMAYRGLRRVRRDFRRMQQVIDAEMRGQAQQQRQQATKQRIETVEMLAPGQQY
jgi:hypothetical protein